MRNRRKSAEACVTRVLLEIIAGLTPCVTPAASDNDVNIELVTTLTWTGRRNRQGYEGHQRFGAACARRQDRWRRRRKARRG
jgi:hypothetical protein